MSKENNRPTKSKIPKFKDIYDEGISEEDMEEIRKRRKKLRKKSQKVNNIREKW